MTVSYTHLDVYKRQAQGKMDLERKGKQSYQGWMFVRLLAFSNGDLQAPVSYTHLDVYKRQVYFHVRSDYPVAQNSEIDNQLFFHGNLQESFP